MTIDRRAFLGSGSLALTASLMGAGARSEETPAPAAPRATREYRRIATEEAFATPEQVEAMKGLARSVWRNLDFDLWRTLVDPTNGPRSRLRALLLDLENVRIDIMNRAGVQMQVLSLTSPGVQMFDADTATGIAALANDRLAEIIRRHSSRYAGLATVAPQDPRRAAQEIDRAINHLKLNGVIINSHTEGEYLDQPKYWPILEAAEAVGAPIYIHPRCPADAMAYAFRDYQLSSAMWGFQAETGLHGVRLMMSGVFDRFPKLRIVLGHMGEGIPFWLWRIDYVYGAFNPVGKRPLELMPGEYFRRNFAITTSGMNYHPALAYCIEALGVDNVMFAIDYPYQDTFGSVEFMNTAPIPEEQKEQIFRGNAERIFRIAALPANS